MGYGGQNCIDERGLVVPEITARPVRQGFKLFAEPFLVSGQ
jgi:hypothetical protein